MLLGRGAGRACDDMTLKSAGLSVQVSTYLHSIARVLGREGRLGRWGGVEGCNCMEGVWYGVFSWKSTRWVRR